VALSEYLDQASRRRFEWGKHDCCQFVRGWVAQVTGSDPAEKWRYSTRIGAALLVSRHGGLVALLGSLALAAGLSETITPKAHDVGVIRVLTEDGLQLVAAIFTGTGWAYLTTHGLARSRVTPIIAWAV
jgi:hypothetical protein